MRPYNKTKRQKLCLFVCLFVGLFLEAHLGGGDFTYFLSKLSTLFVEEDSHFE